MSGVSRFISFVIGLIVLILLFILIANRFNADKRTATAVGVTPTVTPTKAPENKGGFDLFGLFRRNTPTPSPTPTLTFAQQMDSTVGNVNGSNTYNQGQPGQQNPNQIPKTGAPSLLLPLASAGLALGLWLRKRA